MQEKFTTYENEVIKYCIERSHRRTISITVLPDGQIVIRAPLRISDKVIEEIVQKKLEWITKKRSEIKEQQKVLVSMNHKSYKDGSNLLFEGRLYPLHIIVEEQRKSAKVTYNGNLFTLQVNNIEKEYIRSVLRAWYREEARDKFTERVSFYESYIPKPYGMIRIKEQKGCYGSCSSKGNLNFNWKCILAPPEILDYVVVHELCHLVFLNHSKQYWSLVEKIMPDYKRRRNWLKENGRLLDY